MESVKDKVVLITGSSSGIGAATAVQFAKYGSHLVLTGRNEANLKRTADSCTDAGLLPEKVKIVPGDVTIDEHLQNIVDQAVLTFGTIDILVNNAAGGWGDTGSTQYLSMDDFDLTYRTNLRSVVYLTKLVIPHLKNSKGSIVNISSVSGIKGGQQITAYSMMKAALDMFTKDLALELAAEGIRVNSVNPGHIDTPLFALMNKFTTEEEVEKLYEKFSSWQPQGRMGQADEVARSIVFLASEASSFTTGALLSVDGGIAQTSSWTPKATPVKKEI